jgi:parallel beta-helix repeat protein
VPRKKTKFIKPPEFPVGAVRPPSEVLSPNFRIDSKYVQDRSVRNPSIVSESRPYTAVVGTAGSPGIDFTTIQDAVDAVKKLGGGTILIKSGTYKPEGFITLDSNIHLIGEDPELTIIDFTSSTLTTNQGAFFAGGDFVTSTGTIATTNGSVTVTGTSTIWSDSSVTAGDTIFINAHPYTVDSVASNTSLNLEETWRGANVSGDTYAILRPKVNISIENLIIRHNRGLSGTAALLITYGIKIFVNRVKAEGFLGFGFLLEGCYNFNFSDCEAHNNGDGFTVQQERSTDRINNGSFNDCYSWGNSNRGFRCDDNSIVRIIGCTANGNDLGIKLEGAECSVVGSHTEFNRLDGIRITDGQANQIVGNNCNSNGSEGISLVASAVTSDDNCITGNQCSLNGDYGVLIQASCDANIVVGNSFQGNTTGSVSDGGSNTKVAHNGGDATHDT